MSSNVASNKRKEAAASLNDDMPRNYDATPVIPINLISHLILPFLPDRRTWNAVCSANKELHEAGMRMNPPWPATKLVLGQRVQVVDLKFSPCGSFLATGARYYPYLVYICDRRGRQTRLWGHTSGIVFLSFSNDGNYLASVGSRDNNNYFDTSIRIWPTDSTTRLPQQSDKTLRGHQRSITCLDFSPVDSNILASGDPGAIKLWNVEQEVCIYSFDHMRGYIRAMCFPPGQDEGRNCIFLASTGWLIRTWWNDLSDIESDIVDMPGLDLVGASAFSHCVSLLAVLYLGSGNIVTCTLYDMRTMTVVQTIPIHRRMSSPLCLAFSPGDKTLVFRFTPDEIQIREVPDLNIKRRFIKRRLWRPDASAHTYNGMVAFDPSGQFLASAAPDENVRLWTL
jgi:WD40 repeat protein